MGLLDIFFKKKAGNRSALFDFFWGRVAPRMKEGDYLKAYKGWVYACVTAIAEDVSTINLHLMHKTKEKVVEEPSAPPMQLLKNVNPFTTSGQLFFGSAGYVGLTGNHFWVLFKNSSGVPLEIWPLNPTRVTVIKDPSTFISRYEYRKDNGQIEKLAPNEVIHFKRWNPLDPYRGIGTVEAAALAIDTDSFSGEWQKNFFYNSALPSGVLKVEGTLTDEEYARLKARWEAQFKGVDNAHKFALLEGGLDWQNVSLTQKEMDFLNSRRFTRDEIMAIFRVPKTILGITEDVNRANAEASEYVFARRVIKPYMQFIVDHLNEFYLPIWGYSQDEWFFKFDDPVPQNVELELKRKQTGVQTGYYTINEVRAEEGKPPVENGDEIYLPLNMMPIGGVIQEPAKQQSGKPEAKALQKEVIEKRLRFVRDEIKKQQKVFQSVFMDMKGDLLNRLKKKKSVKKADNELVRLLFEDWDDWIGILHSPTEDALKNSLLFAGKQALVQVGVDIAFDLTNPRVMDWLAGHVLDHATSIASSVKEEVATRIMEGVEQGLGASEIADSIAEFFDSGAEWRALRVARTEVIAGYGEGTLEGARQSGIVTGKKWLTAGDDRVEEECEMNERDGVLGLNDSFSSGDGAPPVHPNCRCVLQLEV